MTSKSTAALVTLVAATQSAGCYSTFDIQREGLTGLNGFGVPVVPEPRIVQRPHPTDPTRTVRVVLPPLDLAEKKYWLTTVEGEAIQFDQSSSLRIVGKDGLEVTSRFEQIQVENGIFRGIQQDTKAPILVNLPQVYAAQATVRSPGKTALLVLGVGAGTVLTGLFLIVVSGGGAGGRPLRIPGQTHAEPAPILMRQMRHIQKDASNDVMRTQAFTHWVREASAECASIPAFLALARDLARTSAPTNLVRAALRAAQEEDVHTRLCLELAEKQANVRLDAVMPAIPDSVDDNASLLLERLALEAFWDGCVAEGSAAAIARRTAVQTAETRTRLALQEIARDETNHAQLAESIIAYGLSTDRRRIGRALRESFEMRQSTEETRLNALCAAIVMDDVDGETEREAGLARTETNIAANVEAWERSVRMLAQFGV